MKYLIAALFMVAAPIGATAQDASPAATPPIRYQPDPDSPIGTRNPNGPEKLAEYDFLIGDWDVEITFIRPNGQSFVYNAHWHNRWILNGMTVMQEWRGPYATGTEIRSLNLATGEWEGMNFYPTLPNGWRATRSERFDDRMEIYIDRPDGQPEAPLAREVYADITENRMRMYAELSSDDGETWQAGQYHMIMTRRD